jgi:MoaA/NifB/PqqE/SkfB family radical SAM enzyme
MGTLRTIDIISALSPRTVWRVLRGMLRAPVDDRYAGHPLAVCWFTNFSCNARCAFCCKAAEIRAGRSEFPPLPLDRAKALLERIRQSVDILYISGGEPTVYPHITELLSEARRSGFHSIGMSTNLLALDRVPEVLEHLDMLGVSIHSPDPARHAEHLGLPPEAGERVFRNLEALQPHVQSGTVQVLVNCVVTPSNMDTVRDMVEFTRSRGLLLEVVPANEKGREPAALKGNPEYESLIDDLVAWRRAGEAPHLAGSTAYYERIRDFLPFRCFPYGVPNVMPDGRLCTPCDISGQYSVNVLDHTSLKEAVQASMDDLGDYPCVSGHCFKAGIVERSRLFGLLLSGHEGEVQ